MRSARYVIELCNGVKVQMLFTPHLYSFKGTQGVTFEVEDNENTSEVIGIYADIMFCAALNAFVLDGHGNIEDFPHTRGDFHEFMMVNPQSFGKALNFALETLTGKTVKDFTKDGENSPANANVDEGEEEGSKKKARLRWIGLRLRRS